MSTHLTFDVSPHRRVLKHGVLLLNEINAMLSVTIFPGVIPPRDVIDNKVRAIKSLVISYIQELESVTGQDSYLTEFDAPKDGDYVGYNGIIQSAEDINRMRRIYDRLLKLALRGNRATMPYVAMAIRSHVRSKLAAIQ